MDNVVSEQELKQVALTRIIPSRWQPREPVFDEEKLWGLAQSIKRNGLINPVVVFPVRVGIGEEEPTGRYYEIVAGERRTRAVMGLAWAAVDDQITEKRAVETLATSGIGALPDEARAALSLATERPVKRLGGGEVGAAALGAIGGMILARVESGETAEDLQRLHRVAVVENLERESLGPLEEARALEGLQEEYGWSQRELARRIGKSQSYVAQRLALLGLTEEAQEALSTRALSATHARAIARVPDELQGMVTGWATAAVQRDDSPATTRQVQNVARQVAKFVDPERWEPNGERIYEPAARNRLALMRWAVIEGLSNLEDYGERLLALRANGCNQTNWLAKKPVDLVRSDYGIGMALEALGQKGSVGRIWEKFAEETDRTCARCGFFPHCRPGMVEVMTSGGYCRRWYKADVETCENFIGADDPVVILLGGGLQRWFEKLEIEVQEEPFPHVVDVAEYVGGYNRAAAARRDQMEAAEEQKARKHVDEIQAFVDWQAEQPVEWMEHFQAHSCVGCVNYRPELELEDMAPCRFCVEPLGTSWDKEGFRAPEFGVLVAQDGMMLPRCEQFAHRQVPVLAKAGGARFGERKRAMTWLHGMVVRRGGQHSHSHSIIWGVLRWLDYGRPVGKAQDMDRLERWILREWEELGGSEVVATLLDVAMSEAQVRGSWTRAGILRLVNGATGEVEEWAGIDFRYVTGVLTTQYWSDWPEGWARPWENTDLRN